MSPRNPITRILVSPETPGQIDAVRVDLMVQTRTQWSKTAINDEVIRVGLRHLDEVADGLRARGVAQ